MTKTLYSKRQTREQPREGGEGGYFHTLPIRVCAAQRGRDFEAPDLERGIIFRAHESSSTPGDYEEAFI